MSSSASSYFCEHCGENVSKTSYFKHKKLYYDYRSKGWKKTVVHVTDHDEDFIFSDSDSVCGK